MENDGAPDRLSHLETSWTVFFQIHQVGEPGVAVQAARQAMLQRYESVVRRYLRGLVRQVRNREEAVEECFQEFALRFVSGRFRNADPSRGRFRDYLKSALRNLANDHARRSAPQAQSLEIGHHDLAAEPEQDFTRIWRDELLSRVLVQFEASDRKSNHHLYTVLRMRMDEPGLKSPAMAEKLSVLLGKDVDEGWVRKRLHQARRQLGTLILQEIRLTVEIPTDDEVEQELAVVGLLEYCRDFLPKRNSDHK